MNGPDQHHTFDVDGVTVEILHYQEPPPKTVPGWWEVCIDGRFAYRTADTATGDPTGDLVKIVADMQVEAAGFRFRARQFEAAARGRERRAITIGVALDRLRSATPDATIEGYIST